MNSPPQLLNNGAFYHLLNTPIGTDFLQYLSRGLNNLELLLSSRPYKTQSFSYPSSWFPHWFGSEDHTRPWFCPKLVIIINFFFFVLGFPIGLSPRTIQGLGSVHPFSSGISQVAEQEVVLGNGYSPAWAVVRGPPCRTGLGREFISPTDLEAFP